MADVNSAVLSLIIKEEPNELRQTYNISNGEESSFEKNNSASITNISKSPIISSSSGCDINKLSKAFNDFNANINGSTSADSEPNSCFVRSQNKSLYAEYPEETLGSLLLATTKNELLTDKNEFDSDIVHKSDGGSLLHYILEGMHSDEDACSDKNENIELNLNSETISLDKKSEVDREFAFDSPLLEDATLSCSLCPFTTDKRKTLQYHQRSHQKRNTFKCVYCDQSYTKYELCLHIQKIHPEQSIHCLDVFRKKNIKGEYVSAYSHKCNKCDFHASSALLLKRHIRWHLTQTSNYSHKRSQIVCCIGCDFKSTPKLVMHHQQECKTYLLKDRPSENATIIFNKSRYKPVKVEESENPQVIPETFLSNELKPTYESLNNNVVGNESITLDLLKSEQVSKQNKEIAFKCTECPFNAKRSLLLKIHMKEHLPQVHENENTSNLNCPECSYVAINSRRLERHRTSHRRFEMFSCAGCGFKSTPITLRHHQSKCEACPENQKFKNWSNFSCPECSYVATCMGNLERHQKSHERYQTVSCIGCGFKSTPKSLKYHQYKCEACPEIQRNNYSIDFNCSKCSYVATCLGSLEKHQKSHEKYRTLYCAGCGFRSTPKALRYHQYKCEACPQSQRNTTHFGCSKCSYVAACVGSLEKHQKSHERYRIFYCAGCGFKSTPKALKYHQRKCEAYALEQSKNPNKEPLKVVPNFSCPECSYVAVNTARLELHQKTHQKYQNSSCAGCGFQSTPKSLRHHQNKCEACPQSKKIKNQSYFNCSKCSYVAKSSVSLERHCKSHERFQILSCAGCGFKSTPKSLRFHQSKCEACPQHQKYSYRKVLNCSKCSYVATCIGSLKRHQNSHKRRPTLTCFGCGFRSTPKSLKFHQDKCAACPEEKKITRRFDYSCPKCSYVTKTSSNLIRHLNSHKIFETASCVGCGFRSTPKYLAYHQYRCKAYLFKQSDVLEEKSCENDDKSRLSFNCRECSFVSGCPKRFEQHLNSHKNDRILACAGCGFLSTPESLTYHRYKCEAYLLKHKVPNENMAELVTSLSETVPEIFKCSECPFSSGSLSKLNRHVKLRHDLNHIGRTQSIDDSKEIV